MSQEEVLEKFFDADTGELYRLKRSTSGCSSKGRYRYNEAWLVPESTRQHVMRNGERFLVERKVEMDLVNDIDSEGWLTVNYHYDEERGELMYLYLRSWYGD